MSKTQLHSYPRETLEHLLKILKSYRNGLKQIGKRAQLEDPSSPLPVRAFVEIHSGMNETE